METKPNTQTWKPRKSDTTSRIVLELGAIQSQTTPEYKSRAYAHFNGFVEGLEYMRLVSKEQVKALNALAQRATEFCDREPLPEGDELRSMIAEILFHMN